MTDAAIATAMELEEMRAGRIVEVAPAALMSPEQFKRQIAYEKEMREILREYVKGELKEGIHYTNTLGGQPLAKPMLLQDGGRNICSLFKLTFGPPQVTETVLHDGHYRARAYIELFNADGRRITTGNGICSTLESKYAYRKAERVCPACNQPAIIKGKAEYGGGWVCFAKRGGCGAKFKTGDEAIEGQIIGRVDNPDLADIENTVLKMSIKRAKSAAVCDVPLVSELFTPEDDDEAAPEPPQRSKPAAQAKSSGRSQTAPPPERDAEKPQYTTRAVELAAKLKKVHGVEDEELSIHFLPEGVARFEDLTEEQAEGIVPGLVELINAKIGEGKR